MLYFAFGVFDLSQKAARFNSSLSFTSQQL
jgi:hypothetical protein